MSDQTDWEREQNRHGNGEFGNKAQSAPEESLDARAKTLAARELAEDTLAEYGLSDWRVRLDNAGSRLGVCYHERKEIILSRQYIVVASDETTRDTILHEVAHALAGPGAGHGPQWKTIAEKLGVDTKASVRVPEMVDAKTRRRQQYSAAISSPYRRHAQIAPGTKVVVIQGQQYLQGMTATIVEKARTRYLVETEDGQTFRAPSEMFGRYTEPASVTTAA